MTERNINVLVTQTVSVTLDTDKLNEAFMVEFRRYLYDFDSIERHAEHIAQLYARGLVDEFSNFIEGYGNPKDVGIVASISDISIVREDHAHDR